LKAEFEVNDKNKDGKLNKNEFQDFLRSQGYNLSEEMVIMVVYFLV